MPIEVEVPGQGIVEFPDGMGNDEISSILTRQFYPEKIEQKRDELAKETFQARLEGEQSKALSGLTDIGTEAAKAVVRAASHVDPTGFTQGLMQQYGVEPTHVIPPETFLPDVRTVSEVARKGVSGLGIDPNVILPEQYRKPAEEFVAETIASTPEMAPLLAAGTVAPRAVGRVFQAQMLQGVPQTAYTAATAPTAEERIKAGIQTGAGLAFPALIERGMRQPSIPIPDFVGRQLEMQRGAIPPRGEPVAPIERVTPEQAAIAAERMSAPFEGKLPSEPSILAPEKTDVPKTVTMWSSSTPESGKPFYLSDKVSDAESYAQGRPIKQYEVTVKNPFDPATSKDAVLVKLFDDLGGIHEAPQNPEFITALKKSGYDSVVGGEKGYGGESNWIIALDKKQVAEKPDVTPTVTEPAKPEVAATPKLSNKTIASIWNKLVETSRDDVTELLVNWQDARLSEDGTKIIGSVGREREVKTNPSKKSFLEWLNSDKPLDPKEYDLNPEWVSLVERTREKTGFQQKPPIAEAEVVKPAETPVEAVGKVEAEVKSVAQTEGVRPAKEVKSELIQRIEQSIKDAPSEVIDENAAILDARARQGRRLGPKQKVTVGEIRKNPKLWDVPYRGIENAITALKAQERAKYGQVTIEIPGDGTFTIWNTKEALSDLLARANKISTSTQPPKPYSETKPTKAQGQEWLKEAEAQQPAQPIPQGPGARTAQTIEAPESYSGTALKNATAEIERAGWGMREAPEHVRQSIPEAWIRAGRTLERDPMAAQKLVDELQSDPKGRGLSVDESALLLRQKVILTNEMNAAAEGIHTAKTAKEKEKAEADYGLAHERMLTMLDAIKNRGTAWGQEGRWQQVMAREDFSLATLVTQREAALGRKILPGSPGFAELKKHADRLQELNAKLEQRVADVEKEFQDSEVKRALAEAQANANKELPYHPRILELAEGYAKKWDARGAKALAELKEMFGEGQAFSGAPISPAMLDRAIIYGTSKMVRGAVDLAKWTDAMVKDLGEGFRKYAKDVYDASKRAFDQDVKTDFKKPEVERRVRGVLKSDIGTETTLKQIAAKAAKTKEGRLPNINYYLRKLGRVYAREGIKEEGPFLDRMTADVQKVLPQLTRDDVRAIFGGYAEEVRALSKEPVEVILRDMRGQAQELHKLSLLKQKIIPPKLQERATPSEKQRQLRKQVEAEKRTGGFAPPDPEVQLRSAMQSAETRLTNQITDLQREIDTGEKIVKQQRAPLRSEKLDALRARRDALREIHDEVFKKPDLTDAERLEIWKERVKEQIDELRDRRQRGDFNPKPKPDPIRFDKQAIELQFLKEVEHRALMEMRAKDELSKRTTPEVVKDSLKNAAMFAHMAMAGGEFSAVFKQGATGAYSMPIRTAKNFAKSLQAWWSEENQFKIKHKILTRDNAPFYRRDKLEFTDVGGRLSSMEEMYMFRVMDWMKKVPVLSHYVRYMDRFQRAFSTFLNLMRADTYDAMVREMGSSPEAGQSAANYINVATGRGSHSTARFGGSGANAIFFAPRWSISRFQYLLGQPILAAKPGYKKYIVKQYAKTLVGLGSVYALGYAMGGDVDWNPTSSKFGKIQIGNRVIDPLFGLAPVMRIIAQQVTGLRKNYKGKVRPIREGGKLPIFEQQIEGSRKLGPYDPSGAELMGKFAWSKLAPAPEATVSAAAGENVIGEKFSVGQKLGQLVTPITYRDVINAIREEGIDEKTAIDLMAIFGLSSYVEKPKKSSSGF